MSDYTYVSDFGAKDQLNTGDTDKVIKGADFETEFTAIQAAVNSKADTASPTFTGTVTIPTGSFSGTVSFADNAKISMGAGNDLEIYHDGSNSYITEKGTGSLFVKSDGDGIVFRDASNSNYMSMLQSTGEAKLFHIDSGAATQRLTTSSTGIDVNGDTSTDTLTLGSWTIKVDTNELVFEYNGTDVFKLGTDGAVTSADNVTAFGTI